MTPYGALHQPADGVRQRARRAARHGIRGFGAATAPLRTGPDYLVIGTKRGGTTSLARWLLDHPDVAPLFPARETRKGTYFFDVNFGRGLAWYRSHFPTRIAHRVRGRKHPHPPVIGEASPYYLHHPHAAGRARRIAPGAKIIALLRNPVERAHGHWAERMRSGVESLDFSEAIRIENDRLRGEEQRMIDDPRYVSFAHQHQSYIDQGRYARGLRRWLGAFPDDQILVLRSEDLYTDPVATFDQVLDFLGLRPHAPAEFTAWNVEPKDPLRAEDRAFLLSELADDVAQLEALLGRSMNWPDFER